MGFFNGGKGNTNKPVKQKAKAPAKAKKQAKGKALFGKKKEVTMIERMQLEESVAGASLAVLHEIADRGDSAVRELDDGLLIVAFTNEHLVEAKIDPAGEEFGSFTEALRSEAIESIALAGDLEKGVIGIIPSPESLMALEEFDFVEDLAFNWALVAYDLDDSHSLTVLDDTVTLGRLLELANNQDITLSLVDGRIETTSDDEPMVSDYHDAEDAPLSDFDDNEPLDDVGGFDDSMVPSFDDTPDFDLDDSPSFDEPSDFDNDLSMDYDMSSFDDSDSSADMDEPFDYNDASNELDVSLETPSFDETPLEPVVDEGLSQEQTKEAVNRLMQHTFNNTELGLVIDMSKFDDYFDSTTLAQFDTTKDSDSELDNVLHSSRKDANTEIRRFREDSMMELRNKYTTSLRDVHGKLIESLDHRDENTTYGAKFMDIESTFNQEMSEMDRKVSGVVRGLNKSYNESREEYGENAKREAFAVYDTRFKPEHERKLATVRDTISTDIKTERDVQLAEMYQDRKGVALRLLDKAETKLLRNLQEDFRRITSKELEMYDTFRKSFDVFGRRHFADEVLRAKAEAEKLRQSHEAEQVRQHYMQMMATREQQWQEADVLSNEKFRQLEATHSEQLESVRKDMTERIERERKENEELRRSLQESNTSVTKVGEQKEKEMQHRIKVYEDRISAQTLQIDNYEKDKAHISKPLKWLAIATGTIGIALGIIFGFLIGAGSTDVQIAPGTEQAQPQQQQQPSANDSSFYELPQDAAIEYELVLDRNHAA